MRGKMAGGHERKRFIPLSLAITITIVFGFVTISVAVIVFFSVKADDNDQGKTGNGLAHTDVTTDCLYDSIVPVQWLHRKLHQIKGSATDCVRVLDTGTYIDGHDLYLQGHIPGALFFNTSECLFGSSRKAGDFPEKVCFLDYVRRLGISKNTHIVIYDRYLNIVATRTWWTFRVLGHNKVSVLDGGMSRWTEEGYENDTYIPFVKKSEFLISYNPALKATFDEMLSIVKTGSAQIVDSRDPKEFTGEITSSGFKAGHMPGAKNVYLKTLLNNDNTFKSPSLLKQLFKDAGVDLTKPIVSTCRTGVYSTTIAVVLHSLGLGTVPSYDGSWEEWNMKASSDMIVVG